MTAHAHFRPANSRRSSKLHVIYAPHATRNVLFLYLKASLYKWRNYPKPTQVCVDQDYLVDTASTVLERKIRDFSSGTTWCFPGLGFSPRWQRQSPHIFTGPRFPTMALVTLQRIPVSNAASSASISTSNTGEVSGPHKRQVIWASRDSVTSRE